jgi:hypothetical protein
MTVRLPIECLVRETKLMILEMQSVENVCRVWVPRWMLGGPNDRLSSNQIEDRTVEYSPDGMISLKAFFQWVRSVVPAGARLEDQGPTKHDIHTTIL